MKEIRKILDRDEKIIWQVEYAKNWEYVLTSKRWFEKQGSDIENLDYTRDTKHQVTRIQGFISFPLESIKIIHLSNTLGIYLNEKSFTIEKVPLFGADLKKRDGLELLSHLIRIIPFQIEQANKDSLFLKRVDANQADDVDLIWASVEKFFKHQWRNGILACILAFLVLITWFIL